MSDNERLQKLIDEANRSHEEKYLNDVVYRRLWDVLSVRMPKPMTPEWLDHAYAQGMIRVTELKDGAYYAGKCRNAQVARWSEAKQQFTYMRTKFGSRFPEDIEHPENDDGFDLFIPVLEVEPTDEQRIVEDKLTPAFP